MAKNKFSYEIKQGQILYDDPLGRIKWLSSKPDGYRGFENHHPPKQSKSNPQLGYYWGLLIPEITEQLKHEGFTITQNFGKHTKERYYNYDDTHLLLKEYCDKVGDDGKAITLSEQDKESCKKYIENVLWLADKWLNMNRLKLEAKKPKENK